MSTEIRWKYRYTNFSRALSLLREALDGGVEVLNELERDGVIQRFEYTFELTWNTLKDRMEYDGVVLTAITPRNVIREAFEAGLIEDGETWIDMLNDRNSMSHSYDSAKFRRVVESIHSRYLRILGDIHIRLAEEMLE